MPSDPDKARLRSRLAAVKEIGKTLLKQKRFGMATTALRESRVSPSGWPDFFISGTSGRAACVSVCMDDEQVTAEPMLFGEADLPGSLNAVVHRMLEVREGWKQAYPDSGAELSLFVLCPRMPAAALLKNFPEQVCEGVLLAGKEACEGSAVRKTLERLPPGAATAEEIVLLRAHLAPETVLQPAPTPSARRKQSREQQLSLLPQLLDYDQDLFAKMDLWMPEGTHQTAENLSIRLITGAAGTGKSVVLVHRAALLRQFHPAAKILVLTHNKALRSDLESRYQRMNGSGGVEFFTFFSWLGRRWPSSTRIVDGAERSAMLPLSGYDPQFLKDEFDWLHDQGIVTLEDYLAVPRTGRGAAIQANQRRVLFDLFLRYRANLDTAQATDWSRRACDALPAPPRGQSYDFILVDEAQFFARTWLRLIRKSLNPGGHLFLCADPAQGFLGRGQSWREAGLHVTGRSHVLKRPYRNTRQILSFAAANYERQIAGDEDAPKLATTEPALLRDGPEPAEICVGSPQEEITAVIRQAHDLLTAGIAPQDILILCARKWQVNDIQQRLRAAGVPWTNLDAPREDKDRKLGIGTLDSATGLERPIVILSGLREFENYEENPSLSQEERKRHRRLNASRAYMACTRAIERLVIISCARA